MLSGPDGRTLFILAAEWRGMEKVDEALAARTGQRGAPARLGGGRAGAGLVRYSASTNSK